MEAYQQLEVEWAEFNNLTSEGMVCCASGSAALHLSLEALQLPPGSEILTPDLTMAAVPRAVKLAGRLVGLARDDPKGELLMASLGPFLHSNHV